MAIALVASCVLTFKPARVTGDELRRATRGLTISLHRSSPPYAALEDELMDAFEPAPGIRTLAGRAQAELLESGVTSFEPIAARIRIEAAAEARRWRDDGRREIARMASAAKEIVSLRRTIDRRLLSLPSLPLAQSISATPMAAEEIPTKRVRIAELGMDRGQALASLFAPMIVDGGPEITRAFADAVGASATERVQAAYIISQRPLLVAPPAPTSAPPPLPRTTVAIGPARRNQTDSIDLPDHRPLVQVQNASASLSLLSDAREDLVHQSQIVISGTLEMVGGLAISSSRDALSVFREENGQALESGTVSVRDGHYEILASARAGRIVADLRSPAGDTIGRGSVDIQDLGPATARFRYDQVDLKIRPVATGFTGRVETLESFARAGTSVSGTQVAFDSTPLLATTRGDGAYEARGVLEGSSAIARASRAGFWSALKFTAGGASSRLVLVASQAVQAIISAVAPNDIESRAHQDSGMAWGRVLRAGSPAEGAAVDLITGDERAKAVYFNAAGQPDPSLKQTSSNGLWAIYPALPGVQMAQARFGNGVSSEIHVFPAEAGAASQTDIEATPNRRVELRVYDAFRTSQGLTARVVSYGAESSAEIPATGVGQFAIAGGAPGSGGLAFIDVDAGSSYATARLAVDRDRRSALAPMIKQKWIDELTGALRIEQLPNTGAIVEFVMSSRPYRARTETSGARLVYFDSDGRKTAEDFGRPGGGFALLNVPEGLRTVVIEIAGSNRSALRTFLVERRAVGVAAVILR